MFMRQRPLSITQVTPGTVKEVSAMAEETIILRIPDETGLNTFFCSSMDMLE